MERMRMQIPPIPPPVGHALPQDVVTKAVPHVQAMAPLIQNAVDPAAKAEKFNETRSNKDKSKNRRDNERPRREDGEEKDAHTVNISV